MTIITPFSLIKINNNLVNVNICLIKIYDKIVILYVQIVSIINHNAVL